MKLTKEQLKNFVREVMTEESEYQTFFKKALEKTGKSIPDMSDEEKKEFFNKIDSAWDGKGEKNEGNAFGAAVTAAKKAGEDEFEVGGKTFKVEESTDCGCGSANESVNEARKLKIGKEDFSPLLKLTDKELVKLLNSIRKQQPINYKQYMAAKSKGQDTSKIEKEAENLQTLEKAVIAARDMINFESVNEANNDEKYVVIAFHEKGGAFVMTRPGSKKDAEALARSITKSSDITQQKIVKVSDARKVRHLVGKEYLNESVNEGIGTIALGVAGGLLLLKVLKFVLKKVVGAVGMNVKLPKEQLLEVVKKTMEAALTKISSSGVNIVDIITLQSYLKDEINAGRITTIKQIVQVVDKVSKKGKNESVNEGIDWDELILKAKPGSAIKIDGKFRIKDKYGNWRIVHSWKNRHKDDENDVLVNRDIAKIANNKNMKVRKSGSYHIIESVNEISAYSGLSKLAKGETSNVEGINVSKQMADEILKWMSGSPYAKRYKTQIMKQRLGALLPIIFGPFGIEKKLPSNLKGEFTALKNKYSTNEGKADGGKMAKTHVIYQMNVKLTDNATVPGFRVSVKKGSDAEKRAKDLAKKHFGNEFKSIVSMSKALNPEINNVSEVVNEGRAFINAARKAKQEGKTEFEFNGKTYPVTIKN